MKGYKMRRDMNENRDKDASWHKEELSNFVAMSGNRYVNLTTGVIMGHRYAALKVLSSLRWLYTELGNKQPETGMLKYSPLATAVRKGYIKRVLRGEYQPSIDSKLFKNSSNHLCYNTYRPNSVPPVGKVTKEGKEVVDMFVQYVNVIVGEENTEDFIDWLAWTAQNVGKKLHWAPTIYGLYAYDRQFLTKIITTQVFGDSNSSVTDKSIVLLPQNSWADYSFVAINDLGTGGITNKVLTRIKVLIDEPFMEVREKYVTKHTKKSYANFLIFSEDKKELSTAEIQRRRFWVICTPLDHELDVCYSDKFAPLQDLVEEKSVYGKELRHFLLQRDVSSINLAQKPQTDK